MEEIDFSKLTPEDIINAEGLNIPDKKKYLVRLMYEKRGEYDPTRDPIDQWLIENIEDWREVEIKKYTGYVNYATKLSYYVDKFDNLISFDEDGQQIVILGINFKRNVMDEFWFQVKSASDKDIQTIIENSIAYLQTFFNDKSYDKSELSKIDLSKLSLPWARFYVYNNSKVHIQNMTPEQTFYQVLEDSIKVAQQEEEKKQKEEEERKQKEEEEKKQKEEEERKQKEEEERKQKEEEKKQKEEEEKKQKEEEEKKQKEEEKQQEEQWNGESYKFPNWDQMKTDVIVNKIKDDAISNLKIPDHHHLLTLYYLQYYIFCIPVPNNELDAKNEYFASFLNDKKTSDEQKEQKFNELGEFFYNAIDFCLKIRKGFNEFNQKYPGLNIDIKEIGKIINRVLENRYLQGNLDDLTKISENFFLEYNGNFKTLLTTLGSYPKLANPADRYEEVRRHLYYIDQQRGNRFENYLNSYHLMDRSLNGFLENLNAVIYQEAKKNGNYATIPKTAAQQEAREQDNLLQDYKEYHNVEESIRFWVERHNLKEKGWTDKKINEHANFFNETFSSSEVHERIDEFFKNVIQYGVGVPDVLTPTQITELTDLLIEKRQKSGQTVDANEAKKEIVGEYLSQFLTYNGIMQAINDDFKLQEKTNTNEVKNIIKQILSEKNGSSPSDSEVETYFQTRIQNKFNHLPDQINAANELLKKEKAKTQELFKKYKANLTHAVIQESYPLTDDQIKTKFYEKKQKRNTSKEFKEYIEKEYNLIGDIANVRAKYINSVIQFKRKFNIKTYLERCDFDFQKVKDLVNSIDDKLIELCSYNPKYYTEISSQLSQSHLEEQGPIIQNKISELENFKEELFQNEDVQKVFTRYNKYVSKNEIAGHCNSLDEVKAYIGAKTINEFEDKINSAPSIEAFQVNHFTSEENNANYQQQIDQYRSDLEKAYFNGNVPWVISNMANKFSGISLAKYYQVESIFPEYIKFNSNQFQQDNSTFASLIKKKENDKDFINFMMNLGNQILEQYAKYKNTLQLIMSDPNLFKKVQELEELQQITRYDIARNHVGQKIDQLKTSIENQVKEDKDTKYKDETIQELINRWNSFFSSYQFSLKQLKRYVDNNTDAYNSLWFWVQDNEEKWIQDYFDLFNITDFDLLKEINKHKFDEKSIIFSFNE